MRLTQLEPKFLKWNSDTTFTMIDDIKEADGIMFLCPVCYMNNTREDKTVGVHSIICWKPNVPQTTYPAPGRWEMLGTGYDDLELRAGSSSVLLTGGCKAHFFIRNGEIIIC
jgi:hypothetical protein